MITHPASGRVLLACAITDNTLIITIRRVSYLIGNLCNQKILWSGAVFLNSAQTISLSEPISEQKSGIIIVFSRYEDDGNGTQNYGWQTAYIPKYIVNQFPATGGGTEDGLGGWVTQLINASGTITGHKYYYISDQSIIGVDSNGQDNNRSWVFRYVIGI